MSMDAWIPFLVVCLAVELTPGPNMAYLAILSLHSGRRAGLSAVAGIALGLALVGSLAAFGVAAIISNSPFLSHILAILGCGYLLWLARDCWQGSEPLPHAQQQPMTRHLHYAMRGLVTNLLNPKAFVFYVALLPGFTKDAAHPMSAAFLLTGMSVLVASCVHTSLVLLASHYKPFLGQPKRQTLIRKSMALLLVAVALWFAATNIGL